MLVPYKSFASLLDFPSYFLFIFTYLLLYLPILLRNGSFNSSHILFSG